MSCEFNWKQMIKKSRKKKIFCVNPRQPMTFSFTNISDNLRNLYSDLVVKYGGVVRNEPDASTIVMTKAPISRSGDIFNVKFILDSIKYKEVQDLAKYRLNSNNSSNSTTLKCSNSCNLIGRNQCIFTQKCIEQRHKFEPLLSVDQLRQELLHIPEILEIYNKKDIAQSETRNECITNNESISEKAINCTRNENGTSGNKINCNVNKYTRLNTNPNEEVTTEDQTPIETGTGQDDVLNTKPQTKSRRQSVDDQISSKEENVENDRLNINQEHLTKQNVGKIASHNLTTTSPIEQKVSDGQLRDKETTEITNNKRDLKNESKGNEDSSTGESVLLTVTKNCIKKETALVSSTSFSIPIEQVISDIGFTPLITNESASIKKEEVFLPDVETDDLLETQMYGATPE